MTSKDKSNLYKTLIAKYGILQMVIAIEELSELQKELCKALRDNTNIDNLVEEMADVYIMLQQMKLFFGINQRQINKIKNEKLERTKNRLL